MLFPQYTRPFFHNLQEHFPQFTRVFFHNIQNFHNLAPQFMKFSQFSEYIFHNLQYFHNLADIFSTIYEIPQFRGHIFHNLADTFSTIYKTKFVPVEFPQFRNFHNLDFDFPQYPTK